MESSYEYVLQTMYRSKFALSAVYGVQMLLPDVVFFMKGNPIRWFFMDKLGNVKQKTEEESKSIDLVLSHFTESTDQTGCACYLKTKSDSKTIYTVSGHALKEAFDSYAETSRRRLWDYLFTYIPGIKNNFAFVTKYSDKPKETYKTTINSARFQPYFKITAENQRISYSPSNSKKARSKTKAVLNSAFAEKCNVILKSLLKFLENLAHIEIHELELEFIKDMMGNVWLTGVRELQFTRRTHFVKSITATNKCKGEFCDMVWNELMFINEQGDAKETQRAEFWTFDKDEKKQEEKYVIEIKSIILNKEETITVDFKGRSADPLQLTRRKYLSLADILAIPQYRHMRLPNLLKKVVVCPSCYRAYSTIDKARQKHFEGTGKVAPKKPSTSLMRFNELASTRTKIRKPTIPFARSFLSPTVKGISSSHADFSNAVEALSTTDCISPYIHSNETTKQKYVVPPEAELLGLKFALGHTWNLSRQDLLKKSFLTKSSLCLNKLTDLHALGDLIERKLEMLNEHSATSNFAELQKQWLDQKVGTNLMSTYASSKDKMKEPIVTSPNTTSKGSKKMRIRFLANEDDVAAVDQRKAKNIGKTHTNHRKYYEARDKPQEEPKMVPLCMLAKSIISRNYVKP